MISLGFFLEILIFRFEVVCNLFVSFFMFYFLRFMLDRREGSERNFKCSIVSNFVLFEFILRRRVFFCDISIFCGF